MDSFQSGLIHSVFLIPTGTYIYIDCSETKENYKWPFYDHFQLFFWQLVYDHISENWGSDGHFEVLNSYDTKHKYFRFRIFVIL